MTRIDFPAALPLAVLALVISCGCSQGPRDSATSESNGSTASGEGASTAAKAVIEEQPNDFGGDPATLEGRVTFQGQVPPPRKISVTKDVEYCGQFLGERHEVVVSESGGLAHAVVEIREIDEPEEGWNWQRPQEGYVLRQKGCAFEPPLLVMPNGEELKVFNDDRVAHNINTGQWNLMQSAGAEPLTRSVSNRRPVRVTCNIHSWMEGWIYLVQSPFYAVSDAEGNFRIEGVPPGKYRVQAWHPSLRIERATVEFPAGRTVVQQFAFESPFED